MDTLQDLITLLLILLETQNYFLAKNTSYLISHVPLQVLALLAGHGSMMWHVASGSAGSSILGLDPALPRK